MIDIENFKYTRAELLMLRHIERTLDPTLILYDRHPENGPRASFHEMIGEVARGEPTMPFGRPSHHFMDVDEWLSPRVPK